MRVFVTGVAGFLGSHLADALIAEGAEVAGCDSMLGGDTANIPANCEFHEIDCTDRVAMQRAIGNASVVYHCAATAYEGLSVFSPTTVTQNITQATVATLTAAIGAGVDRFVFCSSMARYGTQDEVPFVETMTPKPQDPYGIAKVAAEDLVKNLCDVHGLDWVIVVPHNIVGRRQKYDDPYRNVISIMANLMLQSRRPYIYGDGEQRRCFSPIDDVVEPLVRLTTEASVVGEVVNLGPDREFVTINDVATRLAEIIGVPLEPVYVDARPQEVRLANCSADKARRLLGYQPHRSLDDALEDVVRFIRERGPKPFRYHLDLELETEATPATWRRRLF